MKTCLKLTLAGFAIELIQHKRNKFSLIYGQQVTADLTYTQAAVELGACLMHALALEGKLDNSQPGESRIHRCK